MCITTLLSIPPLQFRKYIGRYLQFYFGCLKIQFTLKVVTYTRASHDIDPFLIQININYQNNLNSCI